MAARTGGTIVPFGQIELDLIATHAGTPFPYPLRIPSFGRIAGEREVLLAVAGQTLQARGLADEDGPGGAAAEVVTALRRHRSAVDVVQVDEDGPKALVAMVYGASALICAQRLDDDPAGQVEIRRVPADAVSAALSAEIPDVGPAKAMPIVLPEYAIDTASRVLDGVEDDAAKMRLLRDLVRDCGGNPSALDELAGLLPELTGRGQLGATRRTGSGHDRMGGELSWLDGPRGRLRVARAGNGWVSVNPLRRADFRIAVDELAALARDPR
ncbi:ESX secretion-associated protein EspG [Saccharopolyspora sp. HNM0983]|uniref:ESX secretion-associated protein EspG n=1 Tax=Saccharopolyspora montiporae TaxID=2781240 RepID=A0A929B9S6_9PSEU|nr:ESX secretion-associated protein EspG [Saccharopolyspora sp. HNM0983]MBE9375889.1 ESX secretion-associated protein EspG [Saccharopolyspora sp. HNM0983]